MKIEELATAIDGIARSDNNMKELGIVAILSQFEDEEKLEFGERMLEDISKGEYNREKYVNEGYLNKRGNNK